MKRAFFVPGARGVALIVVLWAVALISAAMLGLAAILQRQLGQELAALQNSRAVMVAESGLQMALHSQLQPAMAEEAARALCASLQQGWGVPVRFEVRTEDLSGEEGKLNLNALALGDREFCRRVLTNLLGFWNVSPATSTTFVDALLDYVDADRQVTGTNDLTEELAKNAPIERLDEIEKIYGWNRVMEEAQGGGLGKFTIYGPGKLSLRTADQDVLEAWLGLTAGAADAFVQARRGPDGIFGSLDDVVNLGLLATLSQEMQARINTGAEDLWRVTSTGQVGEVRRQVEGLISRTPPQIKARWTKEREK